MSELAEHIFDLFESGEVRAIPSLEGYEISEEGDVRFRGAWVNSYVDAHGYERVYVTNSTSRAMRYVHRLVAMAFLGQQPSAEAFEVAHKDGNQANNHWTNLRWSTHAENMHDMVRHGRSRQWPRNNQATLNPTEVARIRELYALGGTQKEIGLRYGLSQPHIGRIVRGDRWGYVKEGL